MGKGHPARKRRVPRTVDKPRSKEDRVRFAIAHDMIERGASYDAIRDVTGLAKDTIAKIKRGEYEQDWTLVQDLEAGERLRYTLLADRIVTACMDGDKLEKARLSELGSLLNVVMNSRQLAAGRPTQINAYFSMSIKELLELGDRYAKEAGIAPGAGGATLALPPTG